MDLGVLDDLVRLCLQLAGHGAGCQPRQDVGPAAQAEPDAAGEPSQLSEPDRDGAPSQDAEPGPADLEQLSGMSREAVQQAIIGKVADLLSDPDRSKVLDSRGPPARPR